MMIVIGGEYGQLANRLIVLANFIAAAREHSLRIVDPAFAPYAPGFESTARDPLARYPVERRRIPACAAAAGGAHRLAGAGSRLLRKWERRFGRFPGARLLDIGWFGTCDLDGPEFLALARRPGLLFAKGWRFRATASFERHADAIRDFLRPSQRAFEAARSAVSELRTRADVVAGVHIRHGDYREFRGGRYYFELPVYLRWMRCMRESLAPRRAAFLVCSNMEHSPGFFTGLDCVSGPGRAVDDLHALAECDYLLGPPSTFSRWASFVGRKPLGVMWDATQAADISQFSVTTHFDEGREPRWAALMARPGA